MTLFCVSGYMVVINLTQSE